MRASCFREGLDGRAATGRAARALEWLSFTLGGEDYGIDILGVQEIRSYERPTRIADAPEHVCGVLNLRGTVVPIVDLRRTFGLEARFDAMTVTVVLNMGGLTCGIVVDSVSDVLKLTPDQIKPAPEFDSCTVDMSHVIGLGTVAQGERTSMLTLLDIERLMESIGTSSVREACV